MIPIKSLGSRGQESLKNLSIGASIDHSFFLLDRIIKIILPFMNFRIKQKSQISKSIKMLRKSLQKRSILRQLMTQNQQQPILTTKISCLSNKTSAINQRIIQKACKNLQEEFCSQKEYIQLLKISLDGEKETAKRQPQTNLIKQKETFIKCWKRYKEDDSWKLKSNKCILTIISSKSIKRYSSCPSIFKYLRQAQKVQNIQDDLRQQSFSFFLESCSPDVVVNQSISQRKTQSSQFFSTKKYRSSASKNQAGSTTNTMENLNMLIFNNELFQQFVDCLFFSKMVQQIESD